MLSWRFLTSLSPQEPQERLAAALRGLQARPKVLCGLDCCLLVPHLVGSLSQPGENKSGYFAPFWRGVFFVCFVTLGHSAAASCGVFFAKGLGPNLENF